MLKTLFTPFISPSSQKPSAAMMVTSHDINFVMGFIKEEEMFSSANASMATLPPPTTIVSNVSKMKNIDFCIPTGSPDDYFINESFHSNEHKLNFSIKE